MGDTGPQHPQNTTEKPNISQQGGAYLGAFDPQLTQIIEAWPRLGESLRDAVLCIVSNSTQKKEKP